MMNTYIWTTVATQRFMLHRYIFNLIGTRLVKLKPNFLILVGDLFFARQSYIIVLILSK